MRTRQLASHRGWLAAAIASIPLIATLRAQGSFDVVHLSSPQPAAGQAFGCGLCVVDVDRDGFTDIVALQPGLSLPGLPDAGAGWVFYGPTLDEVNTFHARDPAAGEGLGRGGCRSGDVNGDGWADLLVGSPLFDDDGVEDAGRAHVYFGPDFEFDVVLHDPYPGKGAHMGDRGLLLHDVDGDGLEDVFVGAKFHDQRLADGTTAEDSGRIYYWSAKALLAAAPALPLVIENPEPLEHPDFGDALLLATDTDPPTLFVSAKNAVYRFDLASFEQTASVPIPSMPPPPAIGVAGFGAAIATGELGPNDEFGLLVTAHDAFYTPSCPGTGAGAAFVLIGPALDTVTTALVSPDACTEDQNSYGLACRVSDVDRDGQEDLLVSDDFKNLLEPGDLVRLYWGPDYSRVETLGGNLGPVLTESFGDVLACGDLDADGFDELVIYAGMGAGSGGLYIHDFRTLNVDVQSLSIATGGDAHFELDLSSAQAGKSYVAALGVSGSDPGVIAGKGSYVPLNVDTVTMAGLALLGSPILEGFTGTLDADGTANFALHLPGGFPAPLVGSTLTVAAVVIEPDGRLGAGSSAVSLELTR